MVRFHCNRIVALHTGVAFNPRASKVVHAPATISTSNPEIAQEIAVR
jgi:hypothetical protein